MTNNNPTYKMPNTGCLLGTAYQTLVAELARALEVASLPLTVGEYLVMRTLYTRDGMQQCEIAEMVGKDRAAVCRCISGMAKKLLVRTEALSHKCLRVYVAPLGREIEAAVMAVAAERHRALTSLLTPAEMETFATVLNKIINSHNQQPN